MSWSLMKSALTGRNVPTPTCRVRKAWLREDNISGVKCSPAVGAAMAPSSRAKVRLVSVPISSVAFPVHVVGEGELPVGFLIDYAVPADDSISIF